MAPASLRLHQSPSAAWDLSANPREVFIFIFQSTGFDKMENFGPALHPHHPQQVCWRCYLNSGIMAPAREAAGSAGLGRSTCFLGAAQEGCFFLLVKQINADIMHHQRFFYQCKQLLLPLAFINNQLRDHLCFLAHCFFTPTQRKSEKMVKFPLHNSCPLAGAGSSGTCWKKAAFAVLWEG